MAETRIKSGAKIAPAHVYNDYVAQLFSEGVAKPGGLAGTPWPECATWAISGECENGHAVAKVLLCGREWCPTCGADDSWAHQRRQGLILKRARQMQSIGYFVIEFPDKSRGKYRTKQSWVDFRRRVVKAMKSLGYLRGMSRWHWYGEKRPGKWNPHLNVLVDDGVYLSKRRIGYIKSVLRDITGEPGLIVEYRYKNTVPKMRHVVRYVTRATFLEHSWDYAVASELHGFRNFTAWGPRGSWDHDSVWGLDDTQESCQLSKVEALEAGLCSKCGKPIVWGEVIPVTLVVALGGRHVGGGYFEMPDTGPPPDRLTDDDLAGIQGWLDSLHVTSHNCAENARIKYRDIARYQSWVSSRVSQRAVNRLIRALDDIGE